MARARRGSPAGRTAAPGLGDPRAGYFLIDLLAALALAGLLILFVFPLQPQATTPGRMRALAIETVTLLRDARTAAARSGRPVGVTFDLDARTLRAGERVIGIPLDVDFALTAGGNCPTSDTRAGIVFRADGTNCGGLLRFTRAGRTWRAEVNWVDGHVDVSEGE